MLFHLLSAFIVLATNEIAFSQKCLMKTICDRGSFGPIPCIADSAPDPVTDAEAKAVLKEVCPHLANEAALCCDKEQIMEMKNSFEIYGLFLKECPACILNYQKVFCHLYCSPKQSTFAKVVNISKSEEGKDQIREIDYFIHRDFANSIFGACKGVTRFGLRIIDMFCKPWEADKCNEERMLKFIGADDEHFGHHPYQIDFYITETDTFKLGNEEFTVAKESGYKCNEPAEDKPACSCAHCPAAC